MAELLINLRDIGEESWRQGHVVDVKPDGHKWGSKEGPPRFIRIKLPGVPVEKVKHLLNDELGEAMAELLASNSDLTDEQHAQIVQQNRRPRAWRLKLENLPTLVRNLLLSREEITVDAATWDTLRTRIVNERKERLFGVVETAENLT